MKKFKESLHIFSPKNKSDDKVSESTKKAIYELGNEIEDNFDEDVENIKFNADDISSFFVKNNELENEKEVSEDSNNRTHQVGNMERKAEYEKMEILFDPITCGPYICCMVILSKKENVEIEFIHPNIFDFHEKEYLSQRGKKKKKVKMITPFNVWNRYKGDWVGDVKLLILERMYLFKETTTRNILCDFYNYKSCKNYHEYNILYSVSGNRYYMISFNYLQDNRYKEIIIISQIPHFDFIYAKFFPVMQSFVGMDKNENIYEETNMRKNSEGNIQNKGETKNNYEKLVIFFDNLIRSKVFEEMRFMDYYVHLSKDIENINNIKMKNILIFLKAVLLEKKIVIVCSNKGNGCRMLLLFLSFIPDIINFGFNVKSYQEKFEEWTNLRLPLILFHEKYVLLLHINNLELFNEYTYEKSYLISTNTDSDVYNYVKNKLDLLYDLDKDELIVKSENLVNALTLTKYENNYLKSIHSIFQSLINFSSLFFEMTKQNGIIISGNTGTNSSKTSSIHNSTGIAISSVYPNCDDKLENNSNTIDDVIHSHVCAYKNGEKRHLDSVGYVTHCGKTNSFCINKEVEINILQHENNKRNLGIKKENMLEEEMTYDEKNVRNRSNQNGENNNFCHDEGERKCHLENGKFDYPSVEDTYIDDEDDICIIDSKSINYNKKMEPLDCIENNENIERKKISSLKDNRENDKVQEKYISDLRNHFHIYFKNFFLLSKEHFEEGKKELREEYELNYNNYFLEIWQKTRNYNYFIEKDFKINKFLKIAEENNVLFDKEKMEDYKFVDDLLIIEKRDHVESERNIEKNLKDVLLISLKGYVYEGTFSILKNCKEGLGKFVYNMHNITFQGEWENDQINGSGHLLYNNKFKYFGNFKNNLFSGNGLFVDNLLNQYEGEFLNGSFNGNGKLIFNKNTYIGIFKNNNLIGKGKILHKNGLIYTGEIKNFLPHGYGFLSYNNNTVFEGYFVQGKKNGNGFLTINQNSMSNGVFCIEGKWSNDQPVLRKKFHILFPNKDKYIGKIYIFSHAWEKVNSKCQNLWNDQYTICEKINQQLFEMKRLIETKIGLINHCGKKPPPVPILEDVEKGFANISNENNTDPTMHQRNVLFTYCEKNNSEGQNLDTQSVGSAKLKCSVRNTISTSVENVDNKVKYFSQDEDPNLDLTEHGKKKMLNEKLENALKAKERKILRTYFEILDKYWIYNIEKKLGKNKDVVEYLMEKNILLIPHREGLSIICDKNKTKENYDGNFCLGLKHGYGISVYDNINRYEGYWYRGMKHGHGILYEGDNIYYGHFNYDKLIQKEEILPEQVSKFKPKKEDTSNMKKGRGHFLINQSFFDYRSFLSSTVCHYL
ncbi:hypothetical protein, conserved [Plasmodium gonderi]|uniref:AVL9/DENND6 domain-containing protein n=1 Tax=Plasmodium gonderi TaxID=77519 RepID=A0A1Y1JN18_PLAGO|nr:hypothetical protein, conserved [Plasmodium gonderi]GAW81444.1 hypothetical protein, conserved [Plasmodium gonderi]